MLKPRKLMVIQRQEIMAFHGFRHLCRVSMDIRTLQLYKIHSHVHVRLERYVH